MKTNFNIIWYVLCWNEMPILPFMIDYWKLIASKVIVFDNNSSDGSVEYLKLFDWIEVRPYPIPTNDQLNDDINMRIKNDCWKEQKGKNVDYVIVSDLDEIIWANNLQERLLFAKDNDINVLIPSGYDFVSQTYPKYNDGELLHEQIKTCVHISMWDKPIIFNPDKVNEINYCPGGHRANAQLIGLLTKVNGLYLFHFKYLSIDYLVEKRFASAVRMSDINKRNRWGYEYLYNRHQIEDQFNSRWNQAKNNNVESLFK